MADGFDDDDDANVFVANSLLQVLQVHFCLALELVAPGDNSIPDKEIGRSDDASSNNHSYGDCYSIDQWIDDDAGTIDVVVADVPHADVVIGARAHAHVQDDPDLDPIVALLNRTWWAASEVTVSWEAENRFWLLLLLLLKYMGMV